MGPFIVVLMGISQVAVPEASRVFHRDSGHLARFCFILGGVQAAAAIVWGAILLTVFPLGPGPALLKELWMPTAQLIPAITLTVAAASFITAATAGLRAMGVARRSLRAQLTGSVAYVVGGSVGAILGGAVGTSWGVTVAQTLRRAGVVASASIRAGQPPRDAGGGQVSATRHHASRWACLSTTANVSLRSLWMLCWRRRTPTSS